MFTQRAQNQVRNQSGLCMVEHVHTNLTIKEFNFKSYNLRSCLVTKKKGKSQLDRDGHCDSTIDLQSE